jgi:hypothetical protein
VVSESLALQAAIEHEVGPSQIQEQPLGEHRIVAMLRDQRSHARLDEPA